MRIYSSIMTAAISPFARLMSQITPSEIDLGLDDVDERGMTGDSSVGEFLAYLHTLPRRAPARYTSRAA